MKRETVLEIRLCELDGKPMRLANVFVDLRLFQNGLYCYGFRFGPTSSGGQLDITYDDIENQRQAALASQPWDYKTTLEECDPVLRVVIMTSEELALAYESVKKWRGNLNHAKAWLASTNGSVVAEPMEIRAEGGHVEVDIRCRRL